MKTEKEHLEFTLETLRAERSQLAVMLRDGQQKADARIDALIKASPIWEQIQGIKAEFEKLKETLQRKNDHLGGKIEGLAALYDEYYRFAVVPGTRMYGIDLSKLDWQTRARVMEGHAPSIKMLGGNPEGPANLTVPSPEPPPPAAAPLPVAPPPPAPLPVAPPPPAPAPEPAPAPPPVTLAPTPVPVPITPPPQAPPPEPTPAPVPAPPAPPAPPPEPPNPQPAQRVISPTEPLSTKALLAQQQKDRELAEQKRREEEAAIKKETAPGVPEPAKKRKR
jgi:hypothetical protein